jgi:hypothetical protein
MKKSSLRGEQRALKARSSSALVLDAASAGKGRRRCPPELTCQEKGGQRPGVAHLRRPAGNSGRNHHGLVIIPLHDEENRDSMALIKMNNMARIQIARLRIRKPQRFGGAIFYSV